MTNSNDATAIAVEIELPRLPHSSHPHTNSSQTLNGKNQVNMSPVEKVSPELMDSDEWQDNDETPMTQPITDNNGNLMEPKQGNTGNVSNESGWIKVVNNPKRKQAEITASAVPEPPSIAARIKARGEKAIDTEQRLITPVRLEYSTKTRKDINLREEFITVFKKMKQVDSTLAIVTNDEVWTTAEEIPVDDKFMEKFSVTQVTAPRRNPAVIIYFTCESKMTLNNIKFNPKVWSHIGTDGIFLSPDRFQTEETACPGFLINVHHKLVWKETLISQMREALQTIQVEKQDPVVQR